jgi:phosphopantothenate-cysteine ligase/phosphopantothenoylcysteine decarboxylase/phosphopantothenate--cysteine ligase
MQKVLITAGSTNVMIDKVRCISNIFKGKTGSDIAIAAHQRYLDVTLITSNPELIGDNVFNVIPYKTYDELYSAMEKEITTKKYDTIIHSAAVSDYAVEGTYAPKQTYQNFELEKLDASKKISSSESELYLKLVPTEKIIDKIRFPWGFKGKLVKFKLQVGITDDELIKIATKSMNDSKADHIVANCLEWAKERAYIISANPNEPMYNVKREGLATRLLNMLE